MILLQKWNFETHEYEPFMSPAELPILYLYSSNLEGATECANCGNAITYGDSFTSRTIHTNIGLGYPVCQDCYAKEWEAEKAAEK